jgi:hypothetical protein
MDSDHPAEFETEEFVSPPSYTQVSARNPFEQGAERKAIKSGWTLNLIVCCLFAATASFQFGYNISSLNSSSTLVKHFIRNHTLLFKVYSDKKAKFDQEDLIKKNQALFKEHLFVIGKMTARRNNCKYSKECKYEVEKFLIKMAGLKKALKERFNWTGE